MATGRRRGIAGLAPLGLMLSALILLGCSEGFPPEFPAPGFKLTGQMSGKTVTREDIEGRPAIIYWFASW